MHVRRYRKRINRRFKPRKRKQQGGLFGFEYLMNKLAGQKQNPNNSLYKALKG